MKIKTTLNIFDCRGKIEVSTQRMDSCPGWTFLGTYELDVEVAGYSDIEIRDMKVDAINQQIEKVKADTEVTLERLRGDIQKLMAIES